MPLRDGQWRSSWLKIILLSVKKIHSCYGCESKNFASGHDEGAKISMNQENRNVGPNKSVL